MINYFEKVKYFIDKNPQLVVDRGISATDKTIVHIEKELSLKLRGEYLQFIQAWGSILLSGFIYDYFAIYLWEDKEILWVIDEAHLCWEKGLDRKLIPILSCDGGEHYCLDPSVDGNQAVYRWDTHFNKIIGKLSDSLFELLWREIEERVIPNAVEEGKQVNL